MRLRLLLANRLFPLVFLVTSLRSTSAAPTWGNAQIAVVYPHDAQGRFVPVERAPLVNVSVWPGPGRQVSCTDPPNPMPLFMAKNNNVAQPVRTNGQMILRTINGVTFPSIEYNDVPLDPPADREQVISAVAGK